MQPEIPSPLHDPHAEAVLTRLHAMGDREFKYLVMHGLTSMITGWFTRRKPGINWDVLSWVALGMPIAVILRHVAQHRLGVRLL